MPDDRLIHGACGHSTKVNSLTDFERMVWALGYKLAADDFGVMRYSAIPLQAKCGWLEQRRAAQVFAALKRCKDVGLIDTFDHQGQAYCFDPAWQTWQKITHPRQTSQPRPDDARLDKNTQYLFRFHPRGAKLSSWQHPDERPERTGKIPGKDREDSGSPPGKLPEDSRPVFVSVGNRGVSGERKIASPSSDDDAIGERAARFIERYQALYTKHRRGAHYLVRPHLDFPKAKELCAVWPDERLDKLATIFLLTDHKFAEEGSRTIGQFAALASWCDGRLAEAGIA